MPASFINRIFKRYLFYHLPLILSVFFFFHLQAKPVPQVLLPASAKSSWIAHPYASQQAYGIFHFRKRLKLSYKPVKYIIHISGDERYRLFVNGKAVASGPPRSDLQHWRYQTIDIAPYLFQGENILASVVWNDGEYSAWAQMSYQTGFLIFGESEKESAANTNTSWRVIEDLSYTPEASIAHITGAFEQVLAQRYPWNWEKINYDDSRWLVPKISESINFESSNGTDSNKFVRKLSACTIPMPEETLQRIPCIRSFTGINNVTDGFLKGTGSLSIQPWADVSILVDQKYLTNAYIELLLNGGKGAKVTLTYAESLFDENGIKGNRNEITNKKIKGNYDVFIADGGDERLFRPLYYRTYRYILLHIENHQQTLELKDLHGYFTAYPFEQKAIFTSDDTIINNIWKTGWRTARLCAFETYMDCPYYEQLQYVGDTRIQALISLYVSGDTRLMKNAIEQIDYSLLPEGITQSRYPSNNKQVIPPFSLLWISMIHDYWMDTNDDDFVKKYLPSVKKILDWHQRYISDTGMLGKMPYWNFVDWAKQWPWTGIENESGTPSGAKEGSSSILTLQYVMALQKAAAIFKYFGLNNEAQDDIKLAETIKHAVYDHCWDPKKKMLSDIPAKSVFSQHAQALGILTETFPKKEEHDILVQTLADTSLIQCTYYYRFYLFQALKKAGLGNEYLNCLSPWKKMLDLGLTTFAETPEPSRSDCHGWSASPCFDLLATVCGITPTSPGFKSVQIKPALGYLNYCDAKMPSPNGIIAVNFHHINNQWKIFIEMPPELKGVLIWKAHQVKLKQGKNYFTF